MSLRGEVIEESLQDKSVLKSLHIVSTRVEKVTKEHKTPWLKQWCLHTIEVDEKDAPELAKQLSKALEPNHWYIDFKDEKTHYVIFPNKVFKVDRKNVENYRPAVDHGLSLNIPIYQLDFSPEIQHWDRPEK
jgi:hypothetical protein